MKKLVKVIFILAFTIPVSVHSMNDYESKTCKNDEIKISQC